jgi:hypothetical protein
MKTLTLMIFNLVKNKLFLTLLKKIDLVSFNIIKFIMFLRREKLF